MKDTTKKALYIFLGALAIVLADQMAKFAVSTRITHWEGIGLITYVQNTGAAFGIFKDATMLFIWAAVIVIGLVLYLYDRIPKRTDMWIYVGMVLGGAFSNLIDRLRLGFVVDYIDLKVWPAFNIADACVTIGMIGIIIYLLRKKKK